MYYTYILTNNANTVMYVGVTNHLKRRMYEHKSGLADGFTKKYHVHKLVYFERYSDPQAAIAREKQLKGWKREKKNNLVEKENPDWIDRSDEYFPDLLHR